MRWLKSAKVLPMRLLRSTSMVLCPAIVRKDVFSHAPVTALGLKPRSAEVRHREERSDAAIHRCKIG